MSQCRVPTWNLKHQKQEEKVELGVERNRSLGVHSKQNPPPLVPMANYEVAEITWENGQLAMHGHGRTNDTLESIVHQATTCHHQSPNQLDQNLAHIGSLVASSSRKCADNSAQYVQMAPSHLKKKPRSESHECGRNFSTSVQDSRHFDRSVCASISATISKDNDTTMITWPSFDSPNWSLKSNKTTDDDSACQDGSDNQEEECKNEGETVRSRPIRRSRAAAIHNQSERKRRERINQKMKALQKLVPNSSKTDKASMLDEVIEYLKQLQAQVQMMRNMPQMMMPLQLQQQQQQLQMSILARIGMGLMMPPQAAPPVPTANPPFVPPPFMAAPPPFMAAPPPMINPARQGGAAPATNNHAAPYCDPYSAFLAQSMSIDLYNKMAALYRQQVNQAAQPMPKPSQSKHF